MPISESCLKFSEMMMPSNELVPGSSLSHNIIFKYKNSMVRMYRL